MPRKKFPWPWFWAALLLPPLLTLVSAVLMRFVFLPAAQNEGVSAMTGLCGGIIGGICCGAMLGIQSGNKLPVKLFLSLVSIIVMVPVCITLCFFGCAFGGYQMRIGG